MDLLRGVAEDLLSKLAILVVPRHGSPLEYLISAIPGYNSYHTYKLQNTLCQHENLRKFSERTWVFLGTGQLT